MADDWLINGRFNTDGRQLMSLRQLFERYIQMRRSLGYDYRTAERALRRFIAFAEEQNAQIITTDLFLAWQKAFGQAKPGTWAARLSMVRMFAQWLHGQDSAHEVPPAGLIPDRNRRGQPYIYSEAEIATIIHAAAQLPSVYGMRGWTHSTLFGLIAVTGLRISEALGLDGEDVDLEIGVLRVRCGKLGKERLLPLSNSVVAHLTTYGAQRDRLLGKTPTAYFVNENGERITDCGARYNFSHVCQNIGLRDAQRYGRHGRGPRIHDLRHSFAARTMIDWYRSGKDADREMIKLVTYLGHINPKSTYWYIEAVPELLALASARLEPPEPTCNGEATS
jgi:integrase/recombinase XerD